MPVPREGFADGPEVRLIFVRDIVAGETPALQYNLPILALEARMGHGNSYRLLLRLRVRGG